MRNGSEPGMCAAGEAPSSGGWGREGARSEVRAQQRLAPGGPQAPITRKPIWRAALPLTRKPIWRGRIRGRVTAELAFEMIGIDKAFPGVVANRNIDFSARWGEVHALLGENGAGKSTLMSILAGLYRPDAGQIFVNGIPVNFHAPKDAIRHGGGMVYQHYRLVDSRTVAGYLLAGLPRVHFHPN